MTKSGGTRTMNTEKAAAIPAAMLIFCALAFLGYSVFQKDAPLLSFSILPENAVLDITLSHGGKTVSLTPDENGAVLFPEKKMTGPYSVAIGIRSDGKNQFRDISISYRPNAGVATITANGFSHNDKIVLSGSDTLHFDWSGKIELSANASAKPSSACIETTAEISFCHTLPEKAGT